MKKNKNLIWVIFGIVIVVSIIVGVWYNNSQNKENIKIGTTLILSGEGASWGIAAKNGVDMAIEDINAKGGIDGRKLEVVHQDDKNDPKQAISNLNIFQSVYGTSIVIGPSWSNTGLPLVEIADKNKILLVSPSLGIKEFNEGSTYIFNTWPHDYFISANLADYVYGKGHRKVALIGTEQVWVKDQTNAFVNRFKELGGSIKVLLEPLPSTKEVSTEALKIKENKDITAIVSTTDGVLVGALIAKRAKELGVNLPIYSITIDKDAINSAGGAYEEMEFLTFLTPSNEFAQRYTAKYGINLDIGSDSAYDAVMMIANAIDETGSTDATILKDYLGNIKEYDGVSGKLISDGKRGFTKPFLVKKVVNGVITDLS